MFGQRPPVTSLLDVGFWLWSPFAYLAYHWARRWLPWLSYRLETLSTSIRTRMQAPFRCSCTASQRWPFSHSDLGYAAPRAAGSCLRALLVSTGSTLLAWDESDFWRN